MILGVSPMQTLQIMRISPGGAIQRWSARVWPLCMTQVFPNCAAVLHSHGLAGGLELKLSEQLKLLGYL
jgi:hypothetical protein